MTASLYFHRKFERLSHQWQPISPKRSFAIHRHWKPYQWCFYDRIWHPVNQFRISIHSRPLSMKRPCHSLRFATSFLTSSPCSAHHCSKILTLFFIFLFTVPFFADTAVASSTRYLNQFPSRFHPECFWIFRPNSPTIKVSPFRTDFRCHSFFLNRGRSCCDCLWHSSLASGTYPFL